MAKRHWRRITPEVRREIIRLAAKGAIPRDIAQAVSRSHGAVGYVLAPLGGVIRPEAWQPSAARLSLDDRVEIRLGLERAESYALIGQRLGRHRSTVCREVAANGGRDDYRPMDAHRTAAERARRPKPTRLSVRPALCDRVVADLERLWSPEQIARRLRAEFSHDPEMWVSHETIYKSIYVQGRGELRRELAACLRTGRAKRRPQGRLEKRGRIPNMVMISERPAEAKDRAVPGHWEGDLIIGKDGKSAIGTLVERTTRFVILLHLAGDRSAEAVRAAIATAIATMPATLQRSLTWDQGIEMAQHVRLTIEAGIDVYFCDPHSPWQRGSNENTNGLLRQYFPKGTDLSVHSPEVLQAAADSLNGRPRQTLGWMTPSEKLAELVASTG
ncbi:MAG TPA: IS30 family transposase [Acidimicrobiales bacterium]|nr:IS30 family transposase [Acidimicrobiales bacterium]